MPRLPRIAIPGFPHHVTQRGNRKSDVFLDDTDRHVYVKLLLEQSIEESLKAVIEHIEQGALDQATRHLDVLNFESLQKRTPDPAKRFGRSGHRKPSVAGGDAQ
jgi:hypothetical protein